MLKEILVIDDNPDIRFLICNILDEQNFKVRSAANYDQAVLEINNRLPDLAIIDIKLDKPDKDGIDLLKLINKKNKLIPVIMISGHATVQIAVEAIRLGAYEFIEKPFSKEKIVNYVNRGLESSSLKIEKDIIENKDNSLDKAENNKMPSSETQEKKIESKSDEVKSEDSDKESKDKTEKNVEVNKEIDVKKIEKGKTDDSLKNKPKKTLTSKDENFKKKSSPNSDKKQNSNENLSRRNEKDQNEFIEKLVSINRVAKVVKGGRRFSFAALVVVGDGNGMVGHGKGKAKEVPEAIKKATDEAKNTMIRVPLRQGRTLHHDIRGRFDSGNVFLRSAPSGTGVIAGGPMRAVFEALGIQDIVAKSIGSSNPHNMVRATFEALKVVSSPKIIASRRGLKVNDITKRRKNTSSIENAKA